MKKINLKPVSLGNEFYRRNIILVYKTCLPFVENNKAKLIHRPITMVMHKLLNKYHISFHFACGGMACGMDKFTMLGNLNDEHVICERCEENAVKIGYKSAEDICGHHVHIGSTKVVRNCCID